MRIAPIGLARMLLKYARVQREERGKYYERVNKCVALVYTIFHFKTIFFLKNGN